MLLAIALLLQTPAAAPAPAVEDARAKEAFAALSAGEQKDLLDYLALELRGAGLLQEELLRGALRLDPRTPAAFAEPVAATWFDPATHAPAQPIPRHALASGAPALVEARKTLRSPDPPRALVSAWSYDYARREVLRLPGWDDHARVFANALAGYEPGHDLAEALVEQALDDGAEQKAFVAFAHTYTDRSGNAYPGVTLFDAYSSGKEFEMPDVDTLGLYHLLRNDWTTYRAPVSNQGPLYKALGEFFRDASRHRGLRHALALCYLEGEPPLGNYAGMLVNFHMAWEQAHQAPSELLAKLPSSDHWQGYLNGLVAKAHEEPAALDSAELRRGTLAAAPKVVRETALAGLKEFGAYQKLEAAKEKDH